MAEETYEEAKIIVTNEFLKFFVSPAFEKLGCEFTGRHFGNGTFQFARVTNAQGEDLPVSWLNALLEELHEDPDSAIKQARGNDKKENAPEMITFEEIVEEKELHPEPPKARFTPIGPAGWPEIPNVDIAIEMPSNDWKFKVITGSEGDKAFVEFDGSGRKVRIRFPRKLAIDVAKSMVGLVTVASGHAAAEYLSEALMNPEKIGELLTIMPAALGALSKTPGPAGRGAVKLLKSLGLIQGFKDIMEREARGAESQEEEAPERPANPGGAACPECGKAGRPTGRSTGMLGGQRLYACDNKECNMREFSK